MQAAVHCGGFPIDWHPSQRRRSMTIPQRRSRPDGAAAAGWAAGLLAGAAWPDVGRDPESAIAAAPTPTERNSHRRPIVGDLGPTVAASPPRFAVVFIFPPIGHHLTLAALGSQLAEAGRLDRLR